MVAPGASALATAVEDAPPTQFRPSFGLGIPAEAVVTHHTVSISTAWTGSAASFQVALPALKAAADLVAAFSADSTQALL